MTGREWDERFRFYQNQLLRKKNTGEYGGDMHDLWLDARDLTVESAGPQPGGRSLVSKVGAVVLAPVKAVIGGVGMIAKIIAFVQWLNGKKTTIGAILELISSGIVGLQAFLPELLGLLGVEGALIVTIVGALGKAFMVIGLIHKWIKKVS